jgi:hypothetical protein
VLWETEGAKVNGAFADIRENMLQQFIKFHIGVKCCLLKFTDEIRGHSKLKGYKVSGPDSTPLV